MNLNGYRAKPIRTEYQDRCSQLKEEIIHSIKDGTNEDIRQGIENGFLEGIKESADMGFTNLMGHSIYRCRRFSKCYG